MVRCIDIIIRYHHKTFIIFLHNLIIFIRWKRFFIPLNKLLLKTEKLSSIIMYSKISILIFRVENHTINPYLQENLNDSILIFWVENLTPNPYVQENLNPYILCGKPYLQSLCAGKSQSLYFG